MEILTNNLPIEAKNEISDKIEAIAPMVAQVKELEKKIADFREEMAALMEAYGVWTIKHDKFTISYVGEGVSERFDSVKFKAEHPEMVAEYTKVSKRKAYVTIK